MEMITSTLELYMSTDDTSNLPYMSVYCQLALAPPKAFLMPRSSCCIRLRALELSRPTAFT